MLINPAYLKDINPSGSRILKREKDTASLGRSFSKILSIADQDCVGFIARPGVGKSTLASGIYKGFGVEFGSIAKMMIGVNGINSELLQSGVIRHFDLAVQPDDEDVHIPSHWRVLESGLDKPGIELVEHARKWRENRFDYIFELDTLAAPGHIEALIYCSPEKASMPAVQAFLRKHFSPVKIDSTMECV